MKKLLRTIALAVVAVGGLFAQDWNLAGAWQGTLSVQGKELRIVVKVSKGDDGGFKSVFYSIDQSGQGINAGSTTLQSSTVKMALAGMGASYEGKVSADGNAITGTFTQGGSPLPLNLKRTTPATEWTIPDPPAKVKAMASNAPMAFEVATIKPSKPGAQGKGITMRGPRQFATFNTSLNDLITFAYGVHVKQITGGPAWLDSDFYDISAEPEAEGTPNRKQLEAMLQKLLTDRFKLTFHREKKELSVYAIVLGKSGSKLTKSQGDPNGLPGLGFRGLGQMMAVNSNMDDFAGLMQSIVLDRPVVDQTGLTGRFDFQLKWTPDASQFNGRGGLAKHDEADAPPDLFTAIQEQLGLQLKSVKAPVDVLVIDRVEKPTEN